MRTFLSKTQYLRGLQCEKSLWLLKNSPGEAAPPDRSRLDMFRTGKEVGELAKRLFPGGVEILYRDNLEHMVRETGEALSKGAGVIYEAAFRFDDLFVMADILRKVEGGWQVYEVKSSTSVKDVHIDDLAVQSYVLRGAGVNLTGMNLVTINTGYVRREAIEPAELFNITDVTGEVIKNAGEVKGRLKSMREALGGACPEIDIGPQCTDPYECDFIPFCWAHIPRKSVFSLRGRGADKFALYREGKISFTDLDLAALNDAQRMQVEAELENTVTLDKEAIKSFLSTLHYPIFFLDFETLRDAVPPFPGTSPYEQIPFQYSLHSIETEGGELRHFEFLAREGRDEREEMARTLTERIPEGATVVAYNMGFERMVLKKLAGDFPGYAKGLMRISADMQDLMVPFKKRQYYTREMEGSYSLKNVLPALLPEFDYSALNITGGSDASIIYKNLSDITDEVKRGAVRRDLLEYCRMDTLALLRLLEELRRLAK
ncbi:MAG: DUF2779 domain-containing protein [Thermodesulfobacteriota bacterium]